jgi:hypothetical protein
MGQYYYAVIGRVNTDNTFAIDRWVHPHRFGNGLKLMEHSYVGNEVVNRVEKELMGQRAAVVWAGDYADLEKGSDENLYIECGKNEDKQLLPPKQVKSIWKDDCGERRSPDARFIVNHTARQWCEIPSSRNGKTGLVVHPLPLLTAEGNGRGGGDYHGPEKYVGLWARHYLEVVPELTFEVESMYEEIVPDFNEDD